MSVAMDSHGIRRNPSECLFSGLQDPSHSHGEQSLPHYFLALVVGKVGEVRLAPGIGFPDILLDIIAENLGYRHAEFQQSSAV